VLHGVEPRAFGEHPAGEDALNLAGELGLIDLDEGRGAGRFGRRRAGAHPRRHFERAELHRVVDANLERRDTPRDLIEGGEDGNRVLDLLGARLACGKHAGHDEASEQ
jgi:hypothetical protein